MLEVFEQALLDMCEQFVMDNCPEIGMLDFELSTDFAFWPKEGIISVSIFSAEDDTKDFREFCASLGLDKADFDVFGVSFLHEVGHAATLETFSPQQRGSDTRRKKLIEDDLIAPNRNFRYFNLPTEKAATQWAINFIKTNFPQYISFCKQVHKLARRELSFITDL